MCDTISNFMEFLNNNSYIFSLLGAVCGYIFSKMLPKIKKHKIKKCLSLNKCECKIILPCYGKELHNKIDVIQVTPVDDIKATSNVIDLIHATGLYSHQQSIIYENNYYSPFDNYNIFCIGGSLANRYTYDIFQQFFPKFKLYASEEKIKSNPNKIPVSHFVSSETERGFCWGESPDESFLVDLDERYAIIVKLSCDDFKIKNHGTLHILFGNGTEGTLATSKYLLYDYKDLYKRVKNKKHYFIAFKLKRNTGLIDTNSFIDLSDKMFDISMEND